MQRPSAADLRPVSQWHQSIYKYIKHVTYHVITHSVSTLHNNGAYYVRLDLDTDRPGQREIHANKAVEAGCTNKLCPFQYKSFNNKLQTSHPFFRGVV